MLSRRVIAFLLAPLFLVVLSAPAFADGASLKVCNKGKVPVEVVVATHLLPFSGWFIKGQTIVPDGCAVVYDQFGGLNGPNSDEPPGEALVGFGAKDSTGRLVSLKTISVPDFGVYQPLVGGFNNRNGTNVLSRDARILCVDPVTTPRYRTPDAKLYAASQCAGLKLPGVSGMVPLTTAYNFYPNASHCSYDPLVPREGQCGGRTYYLNITANPAAGEVAVTGAEAGHEDDPAGPTPVDKAVQDALKKALTDAIKNASEQEEKRKAAADPINRAEANRKIYEARANSIDYAAEHTRNIGRIRELSQFTPDWLRTTDPLLYVRGTVSRVELPSGPRQPARLYFKESPDNAFVACIPVPQLWENLQGYVGKHLEVRGRVSQSNCGGKVADVQIANPAMILDLAKGTPSDEAILPGMNVAPSGSTPPTMAAIPIATRIRVSLTSNIDLLHAPNGATFQGQLAAPVTLPDGVIPQGAAVTLIHNGWAKLGVQSVLANGKIWRVAARIDPAGDADLNANSLPAGMTLVFVVAGTDAPIAAGH